MTSCVPRAENKQPYEWVRGVPISKKTNGTVQEETVVALDHNSGCEALVTNILDVRNGLKLTIEPMLKYCDVLLALKHENVVKAYHYDLEEWSRFTLFMEFHETSLEKFLERHQSLPEQFVRTLARQMMAGLDYLARNGFYLILDPSRNIFMAPSSTLKLCLGMDDIQHNADTSSSTTESREAVCLKSVANVLLLMLGCLTWKPAGSRLSLRTMEFIELCKNGSKSIADLLGHAFLAGLGTSPTSSSGHGPDMQSTSAEYMIDGMSEDEIQDMEKDFQQAMEPFYEEVMGKERQQEEGSGGGQPSTNNVQEQVGPSVANDQEEVEPSTNNVQPQCRPGSNVVQEVVEASTDNGEEEVQPSTSNAQETVQPSTANVQEGVQPSSANVQGGVEPTTANVQDTVQPSTANVQDAVEPSMNNSVHEPVRSSSNHVQEGVERSTMNVQEQLEPSAVNGEEEVEPSTNNVQEQRNVLSRTHRGLTESTEVEVVVLLSDSEPESEAFVSPQRYQRQTTRKHKSSQQNGPVQKRFCKGLSEGVRAVGSARRLTGRKKSNDLERLSPTQSPSEQLPSSQEGIKRVFVPNHILEKAMRPEPRVWMEADGPDSTPDFEYCQVLVPPVRGVKHLVEGGFRRVLREGCAFKIFVGHYGIRNGKGRGVIALEDIPEGKCIMEYTGDLRTEEEVQEIIEKGGNMQYIYDLDDELNDPKLATFRRGDGKRPTSIDAYTKGNAARFCNHSCNPNLRVLNNHHSDIIAEAGLFRVVLYSLREIRRGEELTIDYYPDKTAEFFASLPDSHKIKCLCGAENCKGYIVIKEDGLFNDDSDSDSDDDEDNDGDAPQNGRSRNGMHSENGDSGRDDRMNWEAI